MMNPGSITAGAAIAHVAQAYWPLFVGAAILIIAAAGICSLIYSAQSVHDRDDRNVVNFERWRG